MTRFTVKDLASAGLIAALYTVLSVVFLPISFGVYQIRIAEALTVLPFLTRAAVPGLFIGCLLANIIGGMGWLDIVFGPLITLAAALLTRGTYHLPRHLITLLPAIAIMLLIWLGSIYLLHGTTLSLMLLIGGGVSLLSVGVLFISERNSRDSVNGVFRVWAWRTLSVAAVLVAIFLLRQNGDHSRFLWGMFGLMFVTAASGLLVHLWYRGDNPNFLLAPLPPVLLNAFGVALYLAPLLGFGYWFSVQMVGVGQFVACYGIGLPILLLLRKRKAVF